MKRSEAIQLLGGTVKAAAAEMNITTQAIYAWPEVLSQSQERAVIGHLAMAGKAPKARGSKTPRKALGKSRARNQPARVARGH